jgi:hypothetical protein
MPQMLALCAFAHSFTNKIAAEVLMLARIDELWSTI